MSRKHRFTEALRHCGENQASICRKIDKSPSTLSTILAAETRRGEGILEDCAKILGVPVEWLRTGENPPDWYQPPITRAIVFGGGNAGHQVAGDGNTVGGCVPALCANGQECRKLHESLAKVTGERDALSSELAKMRGQFHDLIAQAMGKKGSK